METPITYNIKYVIKGRIDGRWTIKAYNCRNRPIGTEVIVNTPSECWKLWMLLNGYSDAEPTEILERMRKVS